MSRNLSNPTLAAIYAAETDEIELQLITIGLPTPVRLVNNHEDVVSRGDTYTAHAFELPIVSDEEGTLPRVDVVIDNVSQLLVASVRSITEPLDIVFELVFNSDPDTLVAGPWTFQLREARYNTHSLRMSLQYEPLLDEPYPTGRFTPTDFPGLFRAVST